MHNIACEARVHLCAQAELSNTLKSLLELYDDARVRAPALQSPNELEFRSYYLLLFLLDKQEWDDASVVLAQLPAHAVHNRHISLVVDVAHAVNTVNIVRFFALVRHRASYLQACLLHRCFPSVRLAALRAMKRAYKPANPGFAFVQERLAFATPALALSFVKAAGLLPAAASLRTVAPGGDHAAVDLSTLTDATVIPAGPLPLEPALVPLMTGVCSRYVLKSSGIHTPVVPCCRAARGGGLRVCVSS